MGINPKNKFKENMKKNLLQEAIADADAIKKLAVQNAKESLNLAFDSKIKSMVDSRLNEEADDMEDDDKEDQDEAKKHAEPDADQEGGESDNDADNKEDADEAFDIDAILAEMEDDTDDSDKDDLDGEKLDESDDEDADDKEPKEDDDAEDGDDSEDESFNLEALLAELAEEDVNESDDKDADDAEGDTDPIEEGEDKGLALSIIVPILQKAGVKQETIDKIVKGAKDMATAMHNQGVGMGEAKKKKATDDENDGFSDHKFASKKDDDGDDLENIKEQMELLASKVKETNLINAKLLYVNKILRENDLSVEQKIKVVNAFDRATSTKEAKIVYSSLSEAFKVKSSKPKTNLKESLGFASKAAGTSTKREIVTEADAQVTRWQKLAGIKLND
jgi:hypothetical protein